MLDFCDPGVQFEKWNISSCAQLAKCSSCPLMVEQFDPASPRQLEIVNLMVGVRCRAALNLPNHGRVLSTSLAIWDLRNVNFGDKNDGKCAFFIRTSVSGGIVSMSQMSWHLSLPRAEWSTVIWVKKCPSKKGIKQCLGLKCSQNYNEKQEKATLQVATILVLMAPRIFKLATWFAKSLPKPKELVAKWWLSKNFNLEGWKAKGKLQSDIQCTFYWFSEQRIFLIQHLIIFLLYE